MNRPLRQQGFLLIAAIVLLIVLSFFALVITDLYVGNTRSGTYHLASGQALFLAESGAQRATHALLSPTVMTPSSTDNRQSCATVNTNLTNVSLGAGVFSVTGGNPFYSGDGTNPAMTVSGTLSATATLIPLANTASLADYAPSGRAMIDREEINYSAISQSAAVCGTSACLTGVTRGVDGTGSVAHASGTPVAQYQCAIRAQGGVPSLNNPRGQRTLTQGIQLQEGWAVGSETASWINNAPVTTVLRWQGNVWNDWSAQVNSANLNAVTCTSYADCWAVGSGDVVRLFFGGGGPRPVATAAHWNGASWTDFSGTLPGGPAIAKNDLDAMACTSFTDCWMVGSYTTGKWTLLHMVGWSGGQPLWAQPVPAPKGYAKNDIDSVACFNANLCWAVGSLNAGFNGRRIVTMLLEWTSATGWSVQTSQLPASITNNNKNDTVDLDAITCSPSSCWAVGAFSTQRAALVGWDATTGTWTDYSGQVPNSGDVESVACADANDCWAGGSWNAIATTLLYWNGVTWSDISGQVPGSIAGNAYDLDGIACRNARDCWVVGSIWTGTTVAMHWDGTAWTDFSGAMPNGNDVEGIALVSPGARPRAAWQEVFP